VAGHPSPGKTALLRPMLLPEKKAQYRLYCALRPATRNDL
jgi:hypothetical protein